MSRTSVKSRRASRLPTFKTGGCFPSSMRAICWAKLATAKVGACRGPAWLKGRSRIAARPWLRWYWSASKSCVTLLTPYGDSGLSGVASSSRRAPPSGLPYSSAEPTTTTRGMGFCLTTAASRLASSPALVAIVSAGSSQDAAGLLSAATWKTHCGSISRTRLSTRSRSRRSTWWRSEEHTSELQSRGHLVCRLLLEKKKKKEYTIIFNKKNKKTKKKQKH